MKTSDRAIRLLLLVGLIDAAFIIGTGLALWFAMSNPFLAQIGNLPGVNSPPVGLSIESWAVGIVIALLGQAICLAVGVFAVWMARERVDDPTGRIVIIFAAVVIQVEGLVCWLPLAKAALNA